MPLDFTCPRCAKSMRVPDAMMGQRVACPHCGEPIQLPAPLPAFAAPLPLDLPEELPEELPAPAPRAVPTRPANPFEFIDPGLADAGGSRARGEAPAPLDPEADRPPERPRTSASELPEPWPGVYRGFLALQASGLLVGGGMTGLGIGLFALFALRVNPVIGSVVSLTFLLAVGVGGLTALIGFVMASQAPRQIVGRFAFGWVVFWIGLPIAVVCFTLLWWRHLNGLGRWLKDPTLQIRAGQYWWAVALGWVLVVGAFVVLLVGGERASKASWQARQQAELTARTQQAKLDMRAVDQAAEEARHQAEYEVKIVSHGVAGALLVGAGVLGGVGCIVAHRAAARAVLTKVPEAREPPRRRRRSRDDRDDDDDRDEQPRCRRNER